MPLPQAPTEQASSVQTHQTLVSVTYTQGTLYWITGNRKLTISPIKMYIPFPQNIFVHTFQNQMGDKTGKQTTKTSSGETNEFV